MKGLLSRTPGGPDSLAIGELPEPVAGPGEVVISVHAAGVNFPDALIIEDRYQYRPARPFAPGGELAGTIASVGSGVTGLAPGDRVMALSKAGAMVERIAVPAVQAFHVPADKGFDEAAALIFTYGTVLYALENRGQIEAGETLLVLGAAGGIGIAAIELGKALGARVVAAVSSPQKAEAAREAGADATVVYPAGALDKPGSKALADAFKEACGADGAHVVLDPVGGDYAEPALRAIAWEGRYLVVGFAAGIPRLPFNLPLLKSCDIRGIAWGAAAVRDPAMNGRLIARLTALWSAGRVRPRIAETFPLERGGEAIAALAERRAIGKLVVRIAP